MEFTQSDIDSLAEKLDQLSDGEKAALSAAIERHTAGDDVAGFGADQPGTLSLHFDKIEWVYTPGILGVPYGGEGVWGQRANGEK